MPSLVCGTVSAEPPTRRPPHPGLAPDAHQLALRLLALRDHSRAELRRKLLRRGCSEEEVAQALERLRGAGQLDDAEFARGLVRRRSKERGVVAIAAELAAKGVPREKAEAALDELDRPLQVQSARRLLTRWPGLDPRRAAARLQRRGFGSAVVREALGAGEDWMPEP